MKSDEYTSIGGLRSTFQTTHWTAIERIRSDDDIVKGTIDYLHI